MKSEFETWPATPVEASLEIDKAYFALWNQPELLLFKQTEQPGSAGHPALFTVENRKLVL